MVAKASLRALWIQVPVRWVFIFLVATSGMATHADEGAESLWEALSGGFAVLDMRGRVELADIDGSSQAEAYTLRTRLGYGTKPYWGLSGYGEFENVAAIASDHYFNGTTASNGKSKIADPTATEVNQAFAKLSREDWLGSTAIVGRQRIILDDARFVGNVGWRQNEQTYDSVSFKTTLGRDDIEIYYAHLWEIRRIFGDQGSEPNFSSRSHVVNFAYTGLSFLKVVGFVYALDFNKSSPVNSSTSYGLRVSGETELRESWTLGYQGSYARQTDAGENPVDYSAHYVLVDAALKYAPMGGLGIGYELLGSDSGMARFVTPLATAHKFNGWADAFLDNGGTKGLRDLYVYLTPKLPCKLTGKIAYHQFWFDHGGASAGKEIDFVVKRPINDYVSALTKFAYFDGETGSGRADRWRLWLQLTFKI